MRILVIFIYLLLTGVTFAQLKDTDKQYFDSVNALSNPGFENGLVNWSYSGSTASLVTSGANLAIGKSSLAWDATAGSEFLQSALSSVPNSILGSGDCLVGMVYKGGDSNISLSVVDGGGSNVLAPVALSTTSNFTSFFRSFSCPSSGTFRAKLTSSANAAVVYVDGFFLGRNALYTQYLTNNGNSFGTALTLGTNDNQSLVFETNNTTAGSVDTSQQFSFGASNAGSRVHGFYKDVNAGDTTNPVSLSVGNSGTSQGRIRLEYINAAPTGGPSGRLLFEPRNNADSGTASIAGILFGKVGGADTGFIILNSSYQGSTGAFANFFFNGSVPSLFLNTDNIFTGAAKTFDITLSQSDAEFRLFGQANAAGSGISLYGTAHATRANRTYFTNNAVISGVIDASNQWTFGSPVSSTRIHSFVKDVNAGDSTNQVILKIGNSGTNQGEVYHKFTNAAATGGPESSWEFYPRNNANSSFHFLGRARFYKSSGSNIGNYDLSISDGTNLGIFASHIFNAGVPTIQYSSNTYSSEIFEINHAKSTGELRIGAGGNGSTSYISYAPSHATRPNQIWFRTNNADALAIDASQRFGFGDGTIDTSAILTLSPTVNALTSTGQIGFRSNFTGTSAATTSINTMTLRANTPAAVMTSGMVNPILIIQDAAGAGSTQTRYAHLRMASSADSGTTGNAYIADNNSWTGNYFIHSTSTRPSLISGNLTLSAIGNKLLIKEGSNASMGTCTLSGGACTVSNTLVTANSRIFVTSQADGGTPGFLRISARSAGVSFTITSSSGTDTSTVAWHLIEPAP